MTRTQPALRHIPTHLIEPNPDNPRTIFRQEEMDSLLVSVKEYGILVPISVFKEGGRFIIIDGERRWKVGRKLNLPTIPAILQSKPTALENLLLMFNIHALREQWDLFTIANKITKVTDLLTAKHGQPPNEIQLSEETGLSRGTIRRCRLLIELPDRFKVMLLDELRKPKARQKLTEDFFIEMESALRTVRYNCPEALTDVERARDMLVAKYLGGVIRNLRDLKLVGKIATSTKNVSYPRADAVEALTKVFTDKSQGIDDIYGTTVGVLYGERRLISNINIALQAVRRLTEEEREDDDVLAALQNLKDAIEEVLGGSR